MYCSHCGAPDQTGRFCVHCGTALGTESTPQPTVKNTVDVTVNVGGPVLVSAQPPPKIPWAKMIREMKERSSLPEVEYQRAWEIAEERLRACDLLIEEIEGTIALDLLPPHATERSLYSHSLDQRAEGAAVLQKATNGTAVSLANDKLTRAVAGLIATRNALTAMKDRE